MDKVGALFSAQRPTCQCSPLCYGLCHCVNGVVPPSPTRGRDMCQLCFLLLHSGTGRRKTEARPLSYWSRELVNEGGGGNTAIVWWKSTTGNPSGQTVPVAIRDPTNWKHLNPCSAIRVNGFLYRARSLHYLLHGTVACKRLRGSCRIDRFLRKRRLSHR